VSDLSAAVIQAAAQALHESCETHWASLPDDLARGTTMHWADAHHDAARSALAAAAPLIRAEARERIAAIFDAEVEDIEEGEGPSYGDWLRGLRGRVLAVIDNV
jgi:hypothetical protein